MTVVHLGTKIVSTLGIVDDNGNVIQRQPIELQIDVLEQVPFAKAFSAIAKTKGDMMMKLERAEKEAKRAEKIKPPSMLEIEEVIPDLVNGSN